MKRPQMIFLAILAVAIFVLIALGPRPAIDMTVSFDPGQIHPDPETYLAQEEAKVKDIRAGAQKEIVWANADKTKTANSIIYLHGFSATKMETRPLTDNMATELGANLFYTRLAGHGRDGDAMAEPSMNDWLNDTAEAIAIGERIGDRVIIVGASTGATLATWAAAQPELMENVAALILLSPNYAVRGASTGLLNMPWGEVLLPLIMGETRSFEPQNDEHARWWTYSYPSRSILALGALLKAADGIDFARIQVPAMFIYSPNDRVIEPRAVESAASGWGGPSELMQITDTDDPSGHIVAGDILSPSTTRRISEAAVKWIRSLE